MLIVIIVYYGFGKSSDMHTFRDFSLDKAVLSYSGHDQDMSVFNYQMII